MFFKIRSGQLLDSLIRILRYIGRIRGHENEKEVQIQTHRTYSFVNNQSLLNNRRKITLNGSSTHFYHSASVTSLSAHDERDAILLHQPLKSLLFLSKREKSNPHFTFIYPEIVPKTPSSSNFEPKCGTPRLFHCSFFSFSISSLFQVAGQMMTRVRSGWLTGRVSRLLSLQICIMERMLGLIGARHRMWSLIMSCRQFSTLRNQVITLVLRTGTWTRPVNLNCWVGLRPSHSILNWWYQTN